MLRKTQSDAVVLPVVTATADVIKVYWGPDERAGV